MREMFLRRAKVFFSRFFPLLAIVVIAVIIAATNIKPGTYYSGWDNIHAEFNLTRYARQVLFGAWVEHEGLGGPAAQGHLAEIARLPILFILTRLLPANLVRYTYIFNLFLVGGVGMYLYLRLVWLKEKSEAVGNWLAGLGGILYLLHILTLQQFYISFEMFMAQYAFLPFLLLLLHRFTQKITVTTIFLFFLVQVLIAPSGHTPTVFYLGVLFSLGYIFFLMLPKSLVKAFLMSFFVGLLTLGMNAYWILPNLYYSVHDAHYVEESRDNRLFGPESLWSVREAGTLKNMLSGTHYLFNWKDYSFEDKQFEFIFNEWESHLNQPLVSGLLQAIGVFTIAGAVLVIFDRKKGSQRWAILAVYVTCVLFIWIDLFPTRFLFDRLYQSESFLEAFRNPFTKLSIIYSVASVILFIQFFDVMVEKLSRLHFKKISGRYFALGAIAAMGVAIVCTALPSFQGHFISERLRVVYPDQYKELFAYMNSRSRNLRVLQLPQLTHAGWEYYDWQFKGKGNGYQGMGFYFFGMPQPVLLRDFDRWVESSDFFYHELKYALDTKNTLLVNNIFKKYNIDVVIVDETRVDPYLKHDFTNDYTLLGNLGFKKVWNKDFLRVYERSGENKETALLTPAKITPIATNTDRVRVDYVYQQEGDYLIDKSAHPTVLYPLANLAGKEANATFTKDSVEISQTVSEGNYALSIPGLIGERYLTPVAVRYDNQDISISFPKVEIITGTQTFTLPKIADLHLTTDKAYKSLVLFFNQTGVVVPQKGTITPVVSFTSSTPGIIQYAGEPDQGFQRKDSGEIEGSSLTLSAPTIVPIDWQQLHQPLSVQTEKVNHLTARSTFPTLDVDLKQNPSINCGDPKRGSISTEAAKKGYIYEAKDYGVNCNGYVFQYASPSISYLLNFVGKTVEGRGTKLFVNYPLSEVLPEDYLFQAKTFNTTLTQFPLTQDTTSTYFLNWEIRSLGKESKNELNQVQVAAFPLEQLAQLKLNQGDARAKENTIVVKSTTLLFDAIHVIRFECAQAPCYLGIDQTYDDLWLALTSTSPGFRPHFRLNNWANIWEVSGNGQMVVFYVPELVATGSLMMLLLSMGGLGGWAIWRRRPASSKLQKIAPPPVLKGVRTVFEAPATKK